MAQTSPHSFTRERNLILAVLLVLAAAAWALLWQSSMSAGGMGVTMGMTVPLFLAIWVAMMVAMMFPTAAPMILAFARIHGTRREQGQSFVPTWVFVSGYLAIWTLFGVLAYAVASGAESVASQSIWFMDNAARIGGGILVLAGLYQLSPLKNTCLSKCRSPMEFILTSWRSGYGGSFRMGIEQASIALAVAGCSLSFSSRLG